jgi:hypothetical protein
MTANPLGLSRAYRQPRFLVSTRPEALRPRLTTGLLLRATGAVEPPYLAICSRPSLRATEVQYSASCRALQMSRRRDVRLWIQAACVLGRAAARVARGFPGFARKTLKLDAAPASTPRLGASTMLSGKRPRARWWSASAAPAAVTSSGAPALQLRKADAGLASVANP